MSAPEATVDVDSDVLLSLLTQTVVVSQPVAQVSIPKTVIVGTQDVPVTQPVAIVQIPVGDIETMGTETEVGFIAAASSASLQLSEIGDLPPSIIPIDRDEIPELVPGATVVAKVHCGRRSLGYVWLHDVIEAVQMWILF